MYNNSDSLVLLIIISSLLTGLLLLLNYLLSPNAPDLSKISPFECGFSNFSQTRSPFHIHFYLVGLLFLIFDLEIALIFPYVLSSSHLGVYGLFVLILFLLILTIGFIYELGKEALTLTTSLNYKN